MTSVADTLRMTCDEKPLAVSGRGSYRAVDDVKKPTIDLTKLTNGLTKPTNGLTKSSDNVNRNHHYYHKDCFASANDLSKDQLASKEFFNSLDSKLRGLPKRRQPPATALDNRPMFVTTVKTGVFLEPPPELAAILGLRSYASSGSSGSQEALMYSFASRPRVVAQTNGPKQRPKPNNNNNNNNKANKTTDVANSNNNKTAELTNNSKNNNNNVRVRQKRELNAKPPTPNKNVDGSSLSYGNIMYDRRVVRGSTFAQHPVPTTGCESQAARQAEARRRSMARRKAQGRQTRAMRLRIGTPPPVDGRTHELVQTDQYMEELFDHPPGATVSCQTDFFLDRPDTPLYVPAKTGRDAETQIYPGELFHFDTEVQPILEVLVGKTLEQALIEVMEEDELAAIREQQRRFKEIRAAEKAEEERLEEQERRRREEAEKRVAELEEAQRMQRETEDRVAAAVLTQGYIADLLPSVLDGLKDAGYFVDDISTDLEENFMTWLMGEVSQEMQRMVDNRDLLSEIVREILEARAEVYRAMNEPQGRPASEVPSASPLPGVFEASVAKRDTRDEQDHHNGGNGETESVNEEDTEDVVEGGHRKSTEHKEIDEES